MKRTALITIAAVLAMTPAAGEASNGKGPSKKCPDDSFCVWTKANYQGKRKVFSKKGEFNLPKSVNDKVSSVKSRWEPSFVFLYDGKNQEFDSRCFQDNLNVPDLSDPEWNWDNQASSVYLPKKEVLCAI